MQANLDLSRGGVAQLEKAAEPPETAKVLRRCTAFLSRSSARTYEVLGVTCRLQLPTSVRVVSGTAIM
eukprot:4502646-Pleurochrysis_carterae.AAC.1